MEDPTKPGDDAFANAIGVSEKTGKPHCFVCNIPLRNANEHSVLHRHKVYLERCKSAFEDRGESLRCRSCGRSVQWGAMKDHAVTHKLRPWHSADKPGFNLYYRNQMMKNGSRYHCFLCDKTLDYWDSASDHFEDADHARRREKIGQTFVLPPNSYVSTLSHSIVPGCRMTLECKACQETLSKPKDIKVHIKTEKHSENKEKLIAAVFAKSEDSQGLRNGDSNSQEAKGSTCGSTEANSSTKLNELNNQVPRNRGMICNFSLQEIPKAAPPEIENSAKNRDDAAQRKKARKIETPETSAAKEVAACGSAKPDPPAKLKELPKKVPENDAENRGDATQRKKPRTIETPENSVENRVDAAQRKKTKKIEPPEPSVPEEVAASPQKVPQPPISVDALSFVVSSASALCRSLAGNDNQRRRKLARQEVPDPYCVICYCEIPGDVAVHEHLEGRRHREARAKFGCDEIQPIDGEHFFCMSCDRTVSGLADVFRHVGSNTHLSLVSRRQGDENEAINKPEAGKPEAADRLGCLYVVKQNAKKSFCQICDDVGQFPIATRSVNDHVESQRHKIALTRYGCDKIVARETGDFYCECCSYELATIDAVHLHVKEKRHMSCLVKVYSSRERRKERRRVERLTTPVEPEIPGNLLSGYIAKEINAGFSGGQEKSAQRAMISNFTVEPDDFFGPPRQSWMSNEIAQRNFVEQGNYFVYGNFGEHRIYADHGNYADHENPVEYGFSVCGMAEARNWLTVRARNQEKTEQNMGVLRPLMSRDWQEKPLTETPQAPPKRYYCGVCDASAEDRTLLHVHMASHYTEEFKRRRGNGATINGSSTDYPAENEVFPVDESFIDLPLVFANGLQNPQVASCDPQTPRIVGDVEIDRDARPTNPDASPTKRKWKVACLKKVADLLDFVHDHIYDLSEKLADVERGMMLGLVMDEAKIYCLVCRKIVRCSLDDYTEHLASVDHCEYLEVMETDHELFKELPDQYSDLQLANEYMEEISAAAVRCIICDEDVVNEDRALESHIYHEVHERKCEETRAIARRHYETIAPRMRCDWYDVKKYWCVACQWNSESEVTFVNHLTSPSHKRTIAKPENQDKRMIFDFCATCALLWYGYRCTRAYHTAIESHRWLERDGHYVLTELPQRARSLLAALDGFVDEKIAHLEAISEVEGARERMLIEDLEKAVTMRFPRARAYLFGSRISRLGAADSDVDVFLDCRNGYDGNDPTRNDLLFFMNGVHQCLSKYPQFWDLDELLEHCRSPIIRVVHRATGLACDISFDNGLAVENTKLIKAYNQVFPMCRKITLFLKQWLLNCDLTGSDRISSYALYWFVIFYLQREAILPSVAELIAMKRRSHIIAGWEVGVTYNFTYNEEYSDLTLKEFLMRFFTFYAAFDFRYDIACPLLGEVVKKRAFLYPEYLPKEMNRYETYSRGDGKPEPLRIDSAMCIQDPFDLQHNLTKAVTKVQLNRFRKCCTASLDFLLSS